MTETYSIEELEELLATRQTTHGPFSSNARIGQKLRFYIRSEIGWEDLDDVSKEALEYIIGKISRILSGTSSIQHWEDIAGYAQLVINDQKTFAVKWQNKTGD